VWKPKIQKPKLADSGRSVALLGYFGWPFWAKHGGPAAPTDLGTVVLALIGLYGTQKAFNTNKETAAKAEKEKPNESDSTNTG
jgi:hypothetical protein